jgi:hypothetical protein
VPGRSPGRSGPSGAIVMAGRGIGRQYYPIS